MDNLSRAEKIQRIKDNISGKLARYYGCTVDNASTIQMYSACAFVIRDEIMPRWIASKKREDEQQAKKLYYLSVEFLHGRAMGNNLLALDETGIYKAALAELGVSLDAMEDAEPDPGLGNGGLGRLASCFLDSLATLDYSATGCGIRYEYGLFKQCIIDGGQVEVPDAWLEPFGDVYPWEIVHNEDECEVHFGGKVEERWENDRMYAEHTGFTTVIAVPHDMPILGSGTDNVCTLRLWSAHSQKQIDMESFSRGDYMKAVQDRELAEIISKVLYPCENHVEGKSLRLKQHYFFTSATMQYIVKEHKRLHGPDLSTLPSHIAIQINDTHPALAIPELMRILMDCEGYNWDDAWDIVTGVFNYTNHTVMVEALEKWPEQLFKELLPRIYSIVVAINDKFCAKLWSYYPGQWEKIGRMAIVGYNEIRMANLCIAASAHVNGVSALHGDILKQEVFRDFFVVEPWKFLGITNGVTPRRWLQLANPELASLITEAIGEGWKQDLTQLRRLEELSGDAVFTEKFAAVKWRNKQRFADFMRARQGVRIDPETIYDVQAKRLHEYKRQLLNILGVIYEYDRLVNEPEYDPQPATFIFGAKASANYTIAKQTIKLINAVRELILQSPDRIRNKLNVVFLENYNVSSAQLLIPAADISEQISTAGKEASGTGNMKFMLNGAVTLGTMDGANVEMNTQLGGNNIYIFGLRAEETSALYRNHTYSAGYVYETNPVIRKVLDYLINGSLDTGVQHRFNDIYHSLLFGQNGNMADPFLVLKDFKDYITTKERMYSDYGDQSKWRAMSVMNTAASGIFSSDRTVEEYVNRVWHLGKLKK